LKLLAIVGSPRLKGNTNYLVEQSLEEAAKLGAKTEKIILSQYAVSPCLGHDNCASYDTCRQKDDTGWILDKLCEADGVIIATPVYYFNVSAQMKTFIDRNYFLYRHGRKSQARTVGIIVVGASEGIEDTLYTLRQFTDETFEVNEDKIFTVWGYADRLGEAKDNFPLVEEARKLGRRMVASLKMEA
jgi:multimeric flavodoxin WrbA